MLCHHNLCMIRGVGYPHPDNDCDEKGALLQSRVYLTSKATPERGFDSITLCQLRNTLFLNLNHLPNHILECLTC